MTTVTEIEYETVEREIERYECDRCSGVFDSDDILTFEIWDREVQRFHVMERRDYLQHGPDIPVPAPILEGHLCRGCMEAEHYPPLDSLVYMRPRQERTKRRRGPSGWTLLFWAIVGLLVAVIIALAIGP